MASGIIPLESNNSKLEGRIVWSSTSNGSIANSSNLYAELQARRTDEFGPTTGTFTGTLFINEELRDYSKHSSVGSEWVTMIGFTKENIPHNNDGTGSGHIWGNITGPSGTSMEGAYAEADAYPILDTIPRYGTANQSLNSKTETTIKMNWSSDSIVDYIWYSKDNGSSWNGIDVTDGKSGSYTISGLTPNTTYKIKTRVRRKDSQLTTDSSSLSITTYDIAKISSASNFNHGDNTSVTITNPSRKCNNISHENRQYRNIE